MKERAPRNKTLQIAAGEREELMRQTLTLRQPVSEQLIRNRLIWQDFAEAQQFFPANSVDLLIFDPPYNLNKRFAGKPFRRQSSEAYAAWFEGWVLGLKPLLKPQASLYVCADWQSSGPVSAVLERHFIIRNRITWEREKGRGAASNWKNCSEDIWFCTVADDYYFNLEAVKLRRRVRAPYRNASGAPKDWQVTENGNYRLTCPSNLWTDISVPFWSMPENTEHPTQKPEKLLAKLILASSRPGDLVFDPCFGSGTTCVVARKLGRRFSGIEREAEYCQLAVKRLALAESDSRIQGYAQGCFWERNSQPRF